MALSPRTFKDAGNTTRTVGIHSDGGGQDIPVYKPGYGADAADPTVISRTAGLPIVGQRTSGVPSTGVVNNATASATVTGNAAAVGGTGGVALPGTYVVTASPDNANIVVLGDTSANAATRSGSTNYVQGLPLSPGQSYVIDTDDLRSWKFAVRIANDSIAWIKVGS